MQAKEIRRLSTLIKLDYTIESPEERKKLVEQILEETPNPSAQYLEILGDYLVLCMEKQEKKERKLLTENRMATINKRETSLEGLVAQLENGEDGLYNLLGDNNKNVIFQPKVTITKQDLEDIPELREKRESIKFWEEKLKTATGRDAFIIKSTLIELRKDQYVIKNAYRQPIIFKKITRNSSHFITLPEEVWVDENDNPCWSGVSLLDPNVVSCILCSYQSLKGRSEGQFRGDTWYLMQDFDKLYEKALANYPMYRRICEYKMNNYSNVDIQHMLQEEFGFSHSLEYISSLWRNKIPKLIATCAQDDFLVWYHMNIVKSKWKKCNRCGQVKLAHNRFFSINKTSKDGFYSICKECRNKKNRKEK